MLMPRALICVLLLGTLLVGLAQVVLLPPWEGFDETGHYAYIQQVAETGRWPRRGDRMSAEIDDYLAVAPATDQMHPRWTYHRFFSESGDRGAAHDMIRSRPAPPAFQPGNVGNWQAQHPPLYYALLAPVYLLTKPLSLAARLYVLRTCSYLLAWGALCFVAWRAISGKIPDARAAALLPLALAAWPVLFPGWFPEMGRLGNDSLVTVFAAGAFLLFYRIAAATPTLRDHALLGLVLALGVLTKATFLPVAAAALAMQALQVVWPRTPREQRIRRIQGLCVCAATVLAVSGWWYVTKLFETGSVIGSNDAATLHVSGGFIEGILRNLDLRLIVLVPFGLAASFLWSGTWSFVLPPRWMMLPLLALATVIVFGCFRYVRNRPLRTIDWFVFLTIALFVLGIACYSLILFSLIGSPQPLWYMHSLAPIIALPVGYGLAAVAKAAWLRWIAAIGIGYSFVFLPIMFVMNALYASGCALKEPGRPFFDWSSAATCLRTYPQMYENLALLASPALGAALFIAGWLLLLAGAVMAAHRLSPKVRQAGVAPTG